MNRISSRAISILSVVSLAFVMTVAALGQTSSTPNRGPENLTKRELNSLIANAKSPAEHRRIAAFYQATSQEYLAQAKEHEEMIAAYNANPDRVTEKTRSSTIDHCKYFVKSFNDMAAKSQELAQMHEQMAKDSEQK